MLSRLLVLLALLALPASALGAEACPGSGSGPCPYSSLAVIGSRAEGVLRFPEAVAIGPQGDMYVADQLGFTVQRFSPTGSFETAWGSYGGGHGQFGPIGGLAVDAEGDVYVVDSSHDRIEKFGPNGEYLLDWGHAGSEPGEFSFGSSLNPADPAGGGIAVAGEFVYVVDSGNDRIERFNLKGGEPLVWGSKGSEPGQFSYPRGIAADEHEVIVADDDNHRIQQFGPEGAYQAQTGTAGRGAGQFGYPYGVALDAAGNVYVTDDANNRIEKFSPGLVFAGAWGGAGSKPGLLSFPRAIAATADGENYVADTANDRIEVFDSQGDFLRTIGVSARGPGQMTAPQGLALDPTGRLLVSDTDSARVELYSPGGDAYEGQWAGGSGTEPAFNGPAGIGVDRAGSVYVASSGGNRLLRLWGEGFFLSEIGGPAGLGGAQLSAPAAVAVSPVTGETYVADTGHSRVLAYGPEGTLKGAWGGFSHPQALAVDAAGDVYVADTGADRVVKLSGEGAVLGEWGSAGTADGHFRSPQGIGVDAAGDVYVLDTDNQRVQEFTADGRFLDRWGTRGTGPGQFSFPAALAIGCEGDVYVADTFDNRIERFQPQAPAGSGCLPSSAWPPPLPVAPVLKVALPRHAGVLARRGLGLTVECLRGCTVAVSSTLAPYLHRRHTVALAAVKRALPAARVGHLHLAIERRALSRLRRALGRRHGMWAAITIVATGPTGLRTVVHRSYLVTR